jgi:hypothetical protein
LKKQKSRETKRTESVCVVPGVLTGKGITEWKIVYGRICYIPGQQLAIRNRIYGCVL